MRSSLAKLATACLVCAAALAGCSSQATFTQGIGGSYAELNGLTKTVIPITSVCPEPMPALNSWTAPTAAA
jgi:hypothetical protein